MIFLNGLEEEEEEEEEEEDGITESPNVALVSKDAVLDALQRQPFDGHFPSGRLVLVLVDIQQLGQSEIRDLDAGRILDQDVAGGQIPMDQPALLQVGHAAGDLSAPVEQRLGSDLVPVVADVIQEASQRHQLRHQHHL